MANKDEEIPENWENELEEENLKREFAEKARKDAQKEARRAEFRAERDKIKSERENKESEVKAAAQKEKEVAEREKKRKSKVAEAIDRVVRNKQMQQESEERGTTSKDFKEMAKRNKDKKPYVPVEPLGANPRSVVRVAEMAGRAGVDFGKVFERGVFGERTPQQKKEGYGPIGLFEKINQTYRGSPAPKFKPGKKGRTMPSATNIGAGRTIDFGRGSALDFRKMPDINTGSLNIDFSQPLFGKQKKRK